MVDSGWERDVLNPAALARNQVLPAKCWFHSQVEDFVDPNGKISLQREETPSNRWVAQPLCSLVLAEHCGITH